MFHSKDNVNHCMPNKLHTEVNYSAYIYIPVSQRFVLTRQNRLHLLRTQNTSTLLLYVQKTSYSDPKYFCIYKVAVKRRCVFIDEATASYYEE